MAIERGSVKINDVELPVYYENNERIISIPMKIWGNRISPNFSRGTSVRMMIYPWIELSNTIVVAHRNAQDGDMELVGYPAIPKKIYSHKASEINSKASAIKFAKSELASIMKSEDLIFEIYDAKVEMPE